MQFNQLPPVALYIHTPWCVHKCPYCDFNSHQATDGLDTEAYVTALLSDLEQELPLLQQRTLTSIFIGGGTPSLFPATAIHRLLHEVRSRLPCSPDLEITLEANPGTLEADRFAGYRAAGVNRLSIGIQSFDAAILQRLGRIHGPDEATAAVLSARAAGFDNINLDLMFGLPEQTMDQGMRDIQTAIELGPEHISYYQLTLEPNTLFAARPPSLPDEDLIWSLQSAGQAALAAAGYGQYEVSAYARPARQCQHNLNYWRFGDYMGIGAGAHSKLTDLTRQQVIRRWRRRQPRDYIEAASSGRAIKGECLLQPADLILEFMMNALRLNHGFHPELFRQRTGMTLSWLNSGLHEAEARGLIQRRPELIRPTPLGRRFLDDLLAIFTSK